MNGFSMPQAANRKRSRTAALAAVAALTISLLPTIAALSSVSPTLRRAKGATAFTDPLVRTAPDLDSWYNEWKDGGDDDEMYESAVEGYLALKESTGSEIQNADLQRQIDAASSEPNIFLNNHDEDASVMEKLAMGSITEQLPAAAVQALQQNNLNFAGERVTFEQEIQLGRFIQHGAALFKVRSETEDKLGRSISRLEWAEAADMPPKALRRAVSAYRQAKHALVTANIGLAHMVVKQNWSRYRNKGITRDELVQEAALGLMRAAELFDPERGLRFSTYAVVWIKGTLSNSHVVELVKLPTRVKTTWNKIVQAQKDLESSGAAATAEALAQTAGLPVAVVTETQRKMASAGSVLSLDYERASQSRSGTESGSTSSAILDNTALVEDADLAERTQFHADLLAAMARNLNAREARLLRLRYGLNDGHARSLQECADAMGLSYTRVHQLSVMCLKKMREAAEAESLEEYLLTVA